MSDINLTKAVRQNLLSLQNTAKLMATTQNRLATGNKVNTALDNPTNFFTASSLNARAGELDALLDSMNNGVKTLEAADNGLTSITKTLESMQSTLRQARQDKSFETASYTLSTISDVNAKISFSGGAFGTSGAGSVKLMTDSAQSLTTADTMENLKGVLTEAKSTVTGGVTLTGTDLTAAQGKSVTIKYGDDTLTYTTGATLADSQAVADEMNAKIAADAKLKGKLAVTVTGDKLVVTATSAEDKALTLTGAEVFGATATQTTTNAQGSDGKTTFNINGVDVSIGQADLNNTAWSTPAETTANVDALVSAINVQLGNAGSKFKVKNDSGSLKFEAISTSAGALKITGQGAIDLFGATAASVGVTGAEDTSIHLAKTTDDLVNEINSNSSLSSKIKASNDNGKLRIQNLSTQQLDIDGVSSSGLIDAVSTTAASIGGNTVRADLAGQFNELRDQLDKIADDASFNGINILRGDKLTITFNETGTSAIDIIAKDGKSVDSNSLGVPTTVLEQDLDADTSIDAILDKVKTAINAVRSQASTFGSNLSVVENRQNFTKNMMNTLQGGASNLTLADMNEEAANMVALQTRQSLATSSLSMANQADQNVLQLLR
ncbi:Flagellar hook-associated protein FliD [uncultured Pleomorphomonas sp.]|uniref:Flagellin n=1 Tax=uncultured Pleomorphomonas sp. TaxID=442121 RepID=A0A212L534_9HYPH|nr:flagellin [uncultured Pleomorphomonas sp.]SCM72638.1 Flagellar hook-associated protein FliD [uncultured Pleomorphomonas sp.]